MFCILITGFSGGSVVKNPRVNAGDAGSVPGSGRSPGGGNGSPLQCSCLENSMDREAWWATVHGVTKSQTQQHTCLPSHQGFPSASNSKESTSNMGDTGLIPGSGRSPGGGNGNPLQYSHLGNPMDRESWQTKVPGVTKSWTQLNDNNDNKTSTATVSALKYT